MEGKTARQYKGECDAYVQTHTKKLSDLLSSQSNFENKVLKCLFNNGGKQNEKQLCRSPPRQNYKKKKQALHF